MVFLVYALTPRGRIRLQPPTVCGEEEESTEEESTEEESKEKEYEEHDDSEEEEHDDSEEEEHDDPEDDWDWYNVRWQQLEEQVDWTERLWNDDHRETRKDPEDASQVAPSNDETYDEIRAWKEQVNTQLFCVANRRGIPSELVLLVLEWLHGWPYTYQAKMQHPSRDTLTASSSHLLFLPWRADDLTGWRMSWPNFTSHQTGSYCTVCVSRSDRIYDLDIARQYSTSWLEIVCQLWRCSHSKKCGETEFASHMPRFIRLAREDSCMSMVELAHGLTTMYRPSGKLIIGMQYPSECGHRDIKSFVVHVQDWVRLHLVHFRDVVMDVFLEHIAREDYLLDTADFQSTWFSLVHSLTWWERLADWSSLHSTGLTFFSFAALSYLRMYSDPSLPYTDRFIATFRQLSTSRQERVFFYLLSTSQPERAFFNLVDDGTPNDDDDDDEITFEWIPSNLVMTNAFKKRWNDEMSYEDILYILIRDQDEKLTSLLPTVWKIGKVQ